MRNHSADLKSAASSHRRHAVLPDALALEIYARVSGVSTRIATSGAVSVPRAEFASLVLAEEPEGDRYYSDEATTIVVLKAVFERSQVEICLERRKNIGANYGSNALRSLIVSQVWLAQGDELAVVLGVHKRRDKISRVYINERYEVVLVRDVIDRERQVDLPMGG